MNCQSLLLLAALHLGSVPAAPSTGSQDAGLRGTWTLDYVEWLGERTDQAMPASAFDPKRRVWLDLEVRARLIFEEKRVVCHGRLGDPGWRVEKPYQLVRENGRQVLRLEQFRSLIALSGDTLWLCHHTGWGNPLPRGVASDVNDADVVLLVYRRGDHSRRAVQAPDRVRS